MGRTVVNVTGDVVGTLYLARRERESAAQVSLGRLISR